jgi:hypothetical protein
LPKKNLNRSLLFILFLAVLSLLTGYLLSAISFIGKAGIALFYSQYHFLRSLWINALLVFIIWTVLLIVLHTIKKSTSKATFKLVFTVLILTAMVGLLLSYADFRHSLSHRLLGERFHLGVYLFWLGLIFVPVFVLAEKTDTQERIIKQL